MEPVSVYLDRGDAFELSALLHRFATDVLEYDQHRRIEAWNKRKQESLKAVPA